MRASREPWQIHPAGCPQAPAPGRPVGMEQQIPATEITALLGRGTEFDGKLHFEGRVRIDGVFRGEIQSDDTLVIGEGAEVHAEIDVATVIVRGGVVHGNIRAKTAIELHAPGRMVGNLHSPSVFIDRGVEFQGACRMDPVDGPPAAKPVAPRAAKPSPGT
jgi:cytoskeletal protein CcmA (bactofilin family)